ncbi:MAG TPA: thioredoxin-like domain-containing protein [Pirellulaceae bacterium]|nr:thioredoxin-like domain-containing protein [Pirellulaceae bacterium]
MALRISSLRSCSIASSLGVATAAASLAFAPGVLAQGPTVEQAFGLKPLQADVRYDVPGENEVAGCNIESAKLKRGSEWVVRDGAGRVWRRFQDTNADNRLDQWCYFKDGIEVYRDVDSDYDGNVDRYRWAGAEGIRLGSDADEDGVIDRWERISIEESAYELVEAIRTKDAARISALLPSEEEVRSLGLDAAKTDELLGRVAEARKTFAEVAEAQTLLKETTKFVQFGASRPNLIPAETAGFQKDVYVYDQATAIVENEGRHNQVMLGAMALFGEAWKPMDLPQNLVEGATATSSASLMFELAFTGNAVVGADQTNFGEDLQKLIAQLDSLDKKLEAVSAPEAMGAIHRDRAKILVEIIQKTPVPADRENWVKQYAESIAAATQTAGFADGPSLLAQLENQLVTDSAPAAWVAFVQYRRLQAQYHLDVQKSDADFPKIQDAWLKNLAGFVEEFPQSTDAADAMLNLAISEELADKTDEALGWYRKIVEKFPSEPISRKAQGAVRRLDSEGKPMILAGKTTDGRDFRSDALRGKVVLVHYWATWCKPCLEDMKAIRDLQAKYGQYGFVPVGVNLDPEPQALAAFLKENRLPWTQIYEQGGTEGRLAVELGVSSLPTMVMIDAQGNMLGRGVSIGMVDELLRKNLRADAAAGSSAAPAPTASLPRPVTPAGPGAAAPVPRGGTVAPRPGAPRPGTTSPRVGRR